MWLQEQTLRLRSVRRSCNGTPCLTLKLGGTISNKKWNGKAPKAYTIPFECHLIPLRSLSFAQHIIFHFSLFTFHLNVNPCILRIGFDKGTTRWNFITHQHTEVPICFMGIIDTYLAKNTVVRIHGGFPKLLGIHLT